MEKQDLVLSNMTAEEQKRRDLYLKNIANGIIYGPTTGYESVDKTFLKWYTEEAINADLPEKKIYDAIYENNMDNLDGIALNYFGKDITYREFFENIEKAAKSFKAYGISEGDLVTIGMLSTPEAIYSMLALNKIGAVSSMIDPRTNENGIKRYLDENNSKIVLTTDLFGEKFKKALGKRNNCILVNVSLFSSFIKNSKESKKNIISWANFIAKGKSYKGKTYCPYEKGKEVLCVHSGGTTGFPKGVMFSDEGVLASVYQALYSGIEFNREDTWLGIMPLFIIYGASTGTLLPLIKGMKLYLEPLFNPKKLPSIIKKKKPVHMTLAPSHFENIIYSPKLKNEDLSYVIAPTVGGDSMKISLERESNKWLAEHNCSYNVVKGYGSSETCSGVTVCISNDCNKVGSVGIPLPKTTISIFEYDENNDVYNELQRGESGEICVSGPTNMLRYFNSEEDTNLVLKKHEDGKNWVHTGDWGYIDEDGMLYITDRIKRIIIGYSGFKVLPSYVEKNIEQSGLVKDCCVFGIPDTSHSQGEIPVACIVLKDGTKYENVKSQLDKYLQDVLKDFDSLPREYIVVNEIPIIPTNGKVDVTKLREFAIDYVNNNGKKLKKKGFKLF